MKSRFLWAQVRLLLFHLLTDSSSFTCGLAGALASNPVDVVRTRMMNQRVLSGGPLYKGTLDGVMQTWRNEGFFALYKGFWPNWLRLGPWNIIVSFNSPNEAPDPPKLDGVIVMMSYLSWYCRLTFFPKWNPQFFITFEQLKKLPF